MYLDKQGRRWFRGNLHAHSTVSDGVKTPEEVADLYRNQGYDFLAITDHWKPSRAGTDQGLLLLPGCEYDVGNTAAAGIYHIVAIGPEQLVVPKRTDELTAQEVLDGIRQAGGYAILAHPSWSLNQPGEICKLKGVDASEIYNTLSDVPWNGREQSIVVRVPPLGGAIFKRVAAQRKPASKTAAAAAKPAAPGEKPALAAGATATAAPGAKPTARRQAKPRPHKKGRGKK